MIKEIPNRWVFETLQFVDQHARNTMNDTLQRKSIFGRDIEILYVNWFTNGKHRVKVGRHVGRDPWGRLLDYNRQHGTSFNRQTCFVVPTSTAQKAEGKAHATLNKYRVTKKAEIFDCSKEHALEVCRKTAEGLWDQTQAERERRAQENLKAYIYGKNTDPLEIKLQQYSMDDLVEDRRTGQLKASDPMWGKHHELYKWLETQYENFSPRSELHLEMIALVDALTEWRSQNPQISGPGLALRNTERAAEAAKLQAETVAVEAEAKRQKALAMEKARQADADYNFRFWCIVIGSIALLAWALE